MKIGLHKIAQFVLIVWGHFSTIDHIKPPNLLWKCFHQSLQNSYLQYYDTIHEPIAINVQSYENIFTFDYLSSK